MRLEKKPKITASKKKRRGRGYGSGKGGHTVGRGAKGFKARGKVGLTFTGTKIKKSFFQRLPLRRGKGKFKSFQPQPLIVNLKYLNLLPTGTVVDFRALVKHGIVKADDAQKFGVKILGEGDLKVALKVTLPVSKGAAKKIKKAGGEVAEEKKKSVKKTKKSTAKVKREKKKEIPKEDKIKEAKKSKKKGE